MPNLNLPTNITPGVTDTFEQDVEAAWGEVNRLSRDTGRRDITSLLANGWTAGSVRIIRIMDRVYWEFFNLNGSAASSTTVMDLSTLTGFLPGFTTEGPAQRDNTGAFTGYFRASATALICPIGYVAPTSQLRLFDYRCSSAWPVTLPGTPVAG